MSNEDPLEQLAIAAFEAGRATPIDIIIIHSRDDPNSERIAAVIEDALLREKLERRKAKR
jgi:hypothetical protein